MSKEPLSPKSFKPRFFSVPTLVGSFVGVILLIFMFWRFLEIDWFEVSENFKSVNLQFFFLSIISYYISFIFRGLRWKMICKSSIRNKNITSPNILTFSGIILMGWFINSIAFMRLGDVYRGWLLSKEIKKTSFSILIGTIIAERVQDIILIIFIIIFTILYLQSSGAFEIPIRFLYLSILSLIFIILGIILLNKTGKYFENILPVKISTFYTKLYKSILNSFSIKQFPYQLCLGVIGWILEMLRFYFVAESINIDLSIWIIILATVSSAILSTIPTPGGFGFLEGGMTALLILFGISDTSAVSLVAIDRIISWLSVILFGGLLFTFWHIIRKPFNLNKKH